MKNLFLIPIILPTEDASPLVMNNSINGLFSVGGKGILAKHRMGDCTNQHIYLCSNATIKEGEYGYDKKTNSIFKNHKQGNYTGLKIEFTTDPKLINPTFMEGEISEWSKLVPAIDGHTKAFIFKQTLSKRVGKLVNFLEELCKRYNQKDNHKGVVRGSCNCKKATREEEFIQVCDSLNCKNAEHDEKIKGVDVEKLAQQMSEKEFPYSDFRGKKNGINDEHTGQALRGAYVGAFEEGYNKGLQSNAGKFSLENMNSAIIKAHLIGQSSKDNLTDDVIKKIIQSLKDKEQPKGGIVIECEMEEEYEPYPDKFYPTGGKWTGGYKIKLKDGQPVIYFK